MSAQCPECQSTDVTFTVNPETLTGVFECETCHMKSDPVHVTPANDIAEKQVASSMTSGSLQ